MASIELSLASNAIALGQCNSDGYLVTIRAFTSKPSVILRWDPAYPRMQVGHEHLPSARSSNILIWVVTVALITSLDSHFKHAYRAVAAYHRQFSLDLAHGR